MGIWIFYKATPLIKDFSAYGDFINWGIYLQNYNFPLFLQKFQGPLACFAYVGNEIVGCGGICLYQEMPSPDNPSGGCAYLMNIYTRPEFRGQGVGKK